MGEKTKDKREKEIREMVYLGDNVSTVHQTASHVLPVAGVALGHHAGRIKDGVSQLCYAELLVEGLLCGDDGCIRAQHEVDAGIWHQVGLELGDVHVQGTIKAKRGGEGRDHLCDQSVEVGVRGTVNVE